MFERFTKLAREAVVIAQVEARRLGHAQIGSEHLLLALTLGPASDPAHLTLAEFGLDHRGAVDQLARIVGTADLDAEALSSLGIDLEEIRRRVESQFGAGALDDPTPVTTRSGRRGLPFGVDAKQVLHLALREAIELRDREISSAHLLLGLVRTPGLGCRIIEAAGVPVGPLRTRLAQRMRTRV